MGYHLVSPIAGSRCIRKESDVRTIRHARRLDSIGGNDIGGPIPKVKAALQEDATIPTSLLFSLFAGLGCLCGSVSVFTTKTSGVQHQIQDALVASLCITST